MKNIDICMFFFFVESFFFKVVGSVLGILLLLVVGVVGFFLYKYFIGFIDFFKKIIVIV